MFTLRQRSRWAERICTLPCCWPPRRRPKARVWKDRDGALWRWEIIDRGSGRTLAHGSAYDHSAALSNGLYALDHLTETIVNG